MKTSVSLAFVVFFGTFAVIVLIATLAVARQRRRFKYLSDYRFSTVLRFKLRNHYPHLRDSEVSQVLEGLRSWFALLLYYPKEHFGMPSRVVDVAWHEFILITREYGAFCQKAAGRMLHHNPHLPGQTGHSGSEALAKTYAVSANAERRVAARHPMAAELHAAILLFDLDELLAIPDGYAYSQHERAAMLSRQADYNPNSACSASGGGCSSGDDGCSGCGGD